VELIDVPSQLLDKTHLGTSFSPLFHRKPLILDVERAIADLKYASTPVETWLKKTVYWFTNEYQGGHPNDYKFRSEEIELGRKFKRAMSFLV
jgi:hypothetical protein